LFIDRCICAGILLFLIYLSIGSHFPLLHLSHSKGLYNALQGPLWICQMSQMKQTQRGEDWTSYQSLQSGASKTRTTKRSSCNCKSTWN
jgi:hypothetical protein